MPPTSPRRPGYSLSVIKSYLSQYGYDVKIQYWNLALRNVIEEFWYGEYQEVHTSAIIKDLIPFYNYYAITRNDERAKCQIKKFLLKFFPNKEHIENHLSQNKDYLCKKILSILKEIDIQRYSYAYVQSKFYKYQLVSTGVLCEILKQYYPDVTTIIEAQEFSRKAQAIMDSFTCYDFATWGEYELPLLTLLNELENGNYDYSSIPNIVYKDQNNTVYVSNKHITEYIDINTTPYADFSDYVAQTYIETERIVFPLEGGRGCHWNQCSFCYMNDGYKYRHKTPERMRDEVLHYIHKYNANLFYYIDNDIIGHNTNSFLKLLEYYKDIRNNHSFHIDFGEFIAHDLSADVIHRMHDAGFEHIQIGYESTSDKMLNKINKKSHFAHLILACKWCFNYGIHMSPQNILRSMPFETDILILDNIQNLYYLRFLLSNKGFSHSMRELCVVSTSRYYKGLVESNRICNWDSTPMQEFMVDNFIKQEYKYDVFLMQTNIYNPLWSLFCKTEQSYRDGNYSYKISYDGDICHYTEIQNDYIIKHLPLSKLEQRILKCCDRVVRTFESLMNEINDKSQDDITMAIKKLHKIGVLYVSDYYNEMVSIITLTK